jgi:TPR repeat protein
MRTRVSRPSGGDRASWDRIGSPLASLLLAMSPGVALAAGAAYDANSLDDCTNKCDAGVGAACNSEGVFYKTGKGGTPVDEGRAATLYQKACDLKNAWGCTNLGEVYTSGRGVPRDEAKAAVLLRQACDLKNPQACSDLGSLYSEGHGVQKDPEQAVALFERACNAGNAVGCRALGWHVAAGDGIAQDSARAAALFQQACDGGEATGCGALGDVLVRGVGVATDRVKGIAYLHKSCDAGSQFGCGKLRQFEAVPVVTRTTSRRAVSEVVQPAMPRGGVKIKLDTDNSQVTLEHVVSESVQMQQVGKYSVAVPVVATTTVCAVPCDSSLDPNWKYRVAGNGVSPSSSFMLGAQQGDSLTLRVHAGSHSTQVAGVSLTATGIVFAIIGAVVLPLGIAQSKTPAEGVGGGSLGIGVAALIPGIVLLARSSTHVTTDSGRDLASTPSTSSAPSHALFTF